MLTLLTTLSFQTKHRLYPTCEWETKQIRKLIGNGQLAARLKGSDVRLTKTDRECPICFMYYSESNVSKCCSAALCTECYLQIKPGKERYCICPFCNNPTMKVVVAKDMDEGDVARREEEEQLVIEATIKSRISQLHGECPGPNEANVSPGGGGEETASEGSFGSSLENYNRSRTFSNTSNVSGSSNPSEHPSAPVTPLRAASSTGDSSDSSALLSLAMSPDDRRALESEMRAQLSHETHRRMESEAEEARMRHAQEWYGSQQGMRSRVREARLTELTGLLERMSSRGGGASGASGNNTDGDGEGESSLLAGRDGAAGSRAGRGNGASLSRLLRAMESTSTSGGRGGGSSLEDLMRLEAAFFLGMDNDNARRPQRSGRNGRNSDADESADGDGDDNDEAADGLGGLAQFGRASSSPFGLGRPGSRRIVRRLGGNRGVSSTHLDTAELLMRGVSEEEQLAMAIAMSMQDSQQPQLQQHIETAANDAEDDDHSSSAGSSSSSGSSDRSGSDENLDENTNAVNAAEEEASNADGAVSLDDDEEEVVFADSAEV